MVARWKSYLQTGAFALSVPLETPLGGKPESNAQVQFWTAPWPYWELQAKAPALFEHFQSSQLVIFKVCVLLADVVVDTEICSGRSQVRIFAIL